MRRIKAGDTLQHTKNKTLKRVITEVRKTGYSYTEDGIPDRVYFSDFFEDPFLHDWKKIKP